MSDIKTLHKTARTLILNLRDGLEQLERSENVSDLAILHTFVAVTVSYTWLLCYRHRTMGLQLAFRDSCSKNYLTCKRSAPRWRVSGVCKSSRKALQNETSGNGSACTANDGRKSSARIKAKCLQKGGASLRRDRCATFGT